MMSNIKHTEDSSSSSAAAAGSSSSSFVPSIQSCRPNSSNTDNNNLMLRRFDRSVMYHHPTIADANADADANDAVADNNKHVRDDELKPLLWNMLRLACLGMTMEAIQENPILVRYVENMFDDDVDYDNNDVVGRIIAVGNDDDDDDDGHHINSNSNSSNHNNNNSNNNNNKGLTRLGVIADWKIKSDDDQVASNKTIIIPGIGAAWIQCWNPKSIYKGYGMVREDIPELTIAVLPEYQDQGIGQILLNDLIAYAKQQRQEPNSRIIIPAISLSVQADNHRAVQLYQRLNFSKVDGSDYTNEEGTTWYEMILWL